MLCMIFPWVMQFSELFCVKFSAVLCPFSSFVSLGVVIFDSVVRSMLASEVLKCQMGA